jgi:hypothetical protein
VRHYGEFPPWDGEAKFGLTWLPGERLWDGSAVWTLAYRGNVATVPTLSKMLRTYYMPGLTKLMNEESVFLKLLEGEKLPLSRAAKAARRKPLWRRLLRVMKAYWTWPV